MQTKYIVIAYTSDDKFYGFLAGYNALGGLYFKEHKDDAIKFDAKKDCVFHDFQGWEHDDGEVVGYYRIHEVQVEETLLSKVIWDDIWSDFEETSELREDFILFLKNNYHVPVRK